MNAEEKIISLTLHAQQADIVMRPVDSFRGPKGEKGDPGTLTGIAEDSLRLGGVDAAAYLTADAAAETYLAQQAAADTYLMKTAQAADSALLAGRPAEYYQSQLNLLDNSDFTRPVNQRGQTVYTAPSAYTIDRWVMSKGQTSLGADGVTLTAPADGSCVLTQFVPGLPDGDYCFAVHAAGQIGYRSFTLSGGTITSISSSGYPGGYLQALFVSSTSSVQLSIRAESGYTVQLRWAALYRGRYTPASLPPYVPKPRELETMACAAYYQRYTASQNWAWYFTGAAMDTQNLRVCMPLPFPMRANPTVTIASSEGITIFTPTGLAAASAVKGTTLYAGTGMLLLYLEANVALTAGTLLALRLNSDIELSADL